MKIIKAKDWLRKCRGTDSKIEAFIGLNYIYSNACAIAKDVMKTPKSFENIPIIIIGQDVRANKQLCYIASFMNQKDANYWFAGRIVFCVLVLVYR